MKRSEVLFLKEKVTKMMKSRSKIFFFFGFLGKKFVFGLRGPLALIFLGSQARKIFLVCTISICMIYIYDSISLYRISRSGPISISVFTYYLHLDLYVYIYIFFYIYIFSLFVKTMDEDTLVH